MRLKSLKKSTHQFIVSGALLTCVACGGGSSDPSDPISGAGTGGDSGNSPELLISNLILAYPEGLSVSAFPSDAGTATALTTDPDSTDSAATSIKAKEEQARRILTGEADSCLPPALSKPEAGGLLDGESCYQFDQDMIYGSQNAGGTGPQARFSGTRNGTSNSGSGEACLVSFARAQLGTAVDLVDRATGLVQSLICQAQKENGEVKLPEIGQDPLDLASALGSALGERARSVTEAKMTRLQDVDSRPVYRTEIEISEPDDRTRRLVLTHSPGSAGDNSTFNGSLVTVVKENTPSPGGSNETPKTRVLGVVYAKAQDEAGATRLRYNLKSARMEESFAEAAITEQGDIDLNPNVNEQGEYSVAGVPYQNQNQAADGFIYIAFDMNPETNEGNLSYWQNPGGNYREGTRGMVFNVAQAEDGTLKGCGVTGEARDDNGQAISIRQALREDLELKPRGFYHPFMSFLNDFGNAITGPQQRTITVGADETGSFYSFTQQQPAQTVKWYLPLLPDQAQTEKFSSWQKGDLMTRQCFMRNDAGAWVIDTTEITTDAGFELIVGTSPKFIAPPKRVPLFNR